MGREEVDVHALLRSRSEITARQSCKLRVDLGSAEVASEQELREERAILSEAGQTQTIGNAGVLRTEHVRLHRTERVADMKHFGELGCAGNRARSQLVREGLEGCDFEEHLDLVDGVSLGRHADAQTVVAQSGIAVVVHGLVDVAVVVVVVSGKKGQ